MADTYTTHLNLIEQDPNSRPDIEKENTNLETLDSEVWARGKTFNGQTVGSDGGFHVDSIPKAENLETNASQGCSETYIIHTTGGEASIPQEGDAWLMLIKGTSVHTGYSARVVNMTVTPMQRTAPAAIEATLNEATFEAYVGTAGVYTIYYDGSAWSTSPTLYGLTVSNTPIEGDNIVMDWDGENDAELTVNAVERQAPPDITATIDEDVFASYVANSGTTTLTYSTAWSADPANYGITVHNTPIAGDVITVVYTKEVRGTITQSNPATFVSCGWNLYNHTDGYARVLKYSDNAQYKFGVAGTYTTLEFSETPTGTRTTITPVSGRFNVQSDGYIHVTGGNATDTAIWMTWSDWGSGYQWNDSTQTQGEFEPYEEHVIDFSAFMAQRFPYGLLKAGSVQDEINLNVGVATSRVERLAYNSTNLANAKASGREYEYDENYIYIEKATADTYDFEVDGAYTAFDHGMEWFTGTEVAVYADTIYGANLKNKLERDVVTISQQTLTDNQKMQVRSNIYAASKVEVQPITITVDSVTSANGNYSHTTTDSRITEDMKAVGIEVGTPETFLAPITVTTGNGSVTLACTNAVGSSTVTLTFVRSQPIDSAQEQPAMVTSSEFNILDGRIGTLSSLTTSVKTSAVAAINSLDAKIDSVLATMDVTTGSTETSTVPTGTDTAIRSLTLSPGYYVLFGGFTFTAAFDQIVTASIAYGTGTTSKMAGSIVRGTGASGGGFNICCFAYPSETQTYKLVANQVSGSSKTISNAMFRAMRIK